MNDVFELSPELLLEQSKEMLSLKAAYENLFSSFSADLQGVNSSWSELLSNNFSGKISAAQKRFMNSLSMLENSAGKVALVANTATELDKFHASRISGISVHMPATISSMLDLVTPLQSEGSGQEFLEQLGSNPAIMRDSLNLSSSQKAILKELLKKGKEGLLGKDGSKILDTMTDILKGDFESAAKRVGKDGVKELIRAVASAQGVTLSSSDLGTYTGYAINLTSDVSKAYIDCLTGEPTIGKALNFAWSCTGKPILETAGDKIYSVINKIPGVSEFYAERGVTDSESLGRVALQEYYRLVTGDDETAEYAGNFYKEHNGLGGGLEYAGSEIISFIKDSGGIGKAAASFGKTLIKDLSDIIDYRLDVEKMCWHSLLGGKG